MSLGQETSLILRNDFRLLWRDLRAGKLRAFSSLPLMLLFAVLIQALMIVMFIAMPHPPPLVVETIVWFFAAFVMLGAAMNHAVTVLFERADFDLLLASPVSARAILLARMVGMIAAAAFAVGIFLVPLLNGAAIGLSPRYLWGYVTWLLVATTVTCAGVWMTLLLVRWLGPRRARTWSQVIAALLGATMYIGFQIQNTLPPEFRGAMATKTAHAFKAPWLTFVARAARGEWISMVALLLIAGLFTYGTTRLLARIFVTGLQESAAVRSRVVKHRRFRFSEGLLQATFRKDVRLIIRDPLLLSRVLPSVFYLVPALFPIVRFGQLGAAGMLAPFSVIASVMLSSQLTTVAAWGEEGWDLIRLSPASTVTLRFAKIAAGMALPATLALLLAFAVAILGRPVLALFGLVTAVICSVGSCWIDVAAMRPTPRKDLIQRTARPSRKRSPVRILAALVFIGIGTAAVALAAHQMWLLASVAFGVVIIAAIACFTLIEMEDIEFEATTLARSGPYDASQV